MELRELRYFVRAAEAESISKAAEQLHMTQPALSHSLQQLEEEYGQQLLIRGRSGTRLTPAGSYLFEMAKNIVEMADQADLRMKTFSSTVTGDINLGTAETDLTRYVFSVASKVMKKYPLLKLHVFQNTSAVIRQRINQGLDDVGMVYSQVDSSIYESLDLPGSDQWVVCMRKEEKPKDKELLGPADLLEKELIIPERALKDSHLRKWFGKDFSQLKIRTTYALGPNIGQMVEAGLGWAVLYDDVNWQTPRDLLCVVPLADSPVEKAHIIWKKVPTLSNAARLLVNQIRIDLDQKDSFGW